MRRGVMTAFRWPLHAGALAFLSLQGGRGEAREAPRQQEEAGEERVRGCVHAYDRVSYVCVERGAKPDASATRGSACAPWPRAPRDGPPCGLASRSVQHTIYPVIVGDRNLA